MENCEKYELRQLVKYGYSFSEIREIVDCCDATIHKYIRAFQKQKTEIKDETTTR